jgi:hypothetical protein
MQKSGFASEFAWDLDSLMGIFWIFSWGDISPTIMVYFLDR